MKRATTMKSATMLIAALGLATGCQPQADGNYEGEPLATIEGTVTSQNSAAPADAEVVVAWLEGLGTTVTGVGSQGDSYQPKTYGTKALVQGAFPADFVLNLYVPPPDSALTDISLGQNPNEAPYALGFIVVAKKGSTDDGVVQESDMLAVAQPYAVVYVKRDVKTGSKTAEFLGLLSAGYHLMEVLNPGADKWSLRETAQGLSTHIQVVLQGNPNGNP